MALKSPLVKSLHEANYSIPFTSLTSVQVEISSACNLRCPQCFNRIPEHVTALMKPELWEEKIKDCINYLFLLWALIHEEY